MVIRSGAILGAVLLAACVLSAPSHAALGVFEDPAPLAAKGGFQPDEVVVRVHGKVRETEREGTRERVHCDVWVDKPDATRALLGTASALL